jgi:hypothetical protein
MSSATEPRKPARRQHDECLRDAVGGWRVCLTSGRIGLAVAAAASDRIRVVLCRPSADGNRPSVARHVRLAAARLLWAGFSVADALDALRTLMARRNQRPGGAVLVAIDLYVTGQVEIAQWGKAVVRHVTAAGKDSALATPLAGIDGIDDRDWLAAMPSPSPSTVLSSVLSASLVPCDVRDRLVQRWLAGAGSGSKQPPPLVIANRVEPRLSWSSSPEAR